MSAHREHVGDAKLANNADACFDLKLLFACWGVQVAILREASRRAASATVAAMPRAIVLLLVSFAAAEGSSVSSSTLKACTSEQEDDAPHEACYGWCAATAANDHCKWCKCRGCGWCDRVADGITSSSGSEGSIQQSSASSVATANGAVCSSDVEDDVAYADCQPFCSESEWRSHCGMCKCKGCRFCSCSSQYEDDSTERQCQAWCSDEYYHDHCSRCKCQGCDFCAHGPTCTPSQPDDSQYEQCDAFCSTEFASTHCSLCKCKGCDFCKEPSHEATCTSGIKGDADHEMCEDFCDPANRGDHCAMCKCRGCDFCECSSPHENDAKVEMCASWCDDDQYDSHCDWCSCKGCQFCRQGGKSCQSFFVSGDIDHEACEDFCSAEAANVHCSYCKCKHCPFCKAEAHKQSVAAAAAAKGLAPIPDGATRCFSGQGHDSLYEQCEGFCDASQHATHCKLCKCKGCHMCSATCNSGIPGDLDVMSCASSCDAALANGICPTCRCRGCAFCNPDGTPKTTSDGEVEETTPAHDETSCVPFNTKDIDHRACQAHCSESLKGTHCETCKCKDCAFCQDFRACSSGIAHDTKWEDCDVSCAGRETCEFCKCRSCTDCAVSASQACDSGILNDSPYLTCLPGVCSSAHKEAHCQLCGCRGCSFCDKFDAEPDAAPAPPRSRCVSSLPGDTLYAGCGPLCSPHLATTQCQMCKCSECSFCTDTEQPCTSEHLADVSTARCERWCSTLGDRANMCSFCSCRGCNFCSSLTQKSGIVPSNAEACPIGAELLILEERQYRGNSWHYEARLRVGVWQPDAIVTIDFARAHSDVEVNEDAFEDASLVETRASGVQVKLGEYGDELKGFTFEFTVRGGQLKLLPSQPAMIECSNVQPLFPSLPSPPPHPHSPFVRSPPPLTEDEEQNARVSRQRERSQCALGGRVKILGTWAGGTSFRGSVVFAVWQPGVDVSIDFNVPGGKAEVEEEVSEEEDGEADAEEGLFASHALHATVLEDPPPGVLRFRLGSTADESDGFTFVAHGWRLGKNARPLFRCSLKGESDSEAGAGGGDVSVASSKKAIIGPTCAGLGLSYRILQQWQGGFKAVLAVRTWQAGARVALRYATSDLQLLDHWSSTRSTSSAGSDGNSEIALTLGDGPDDEHHGFGFTARTKDKGAIEEPIVTCELDTAALLLAPVPIQACGMGASYSVTPNVQGRTGSFIVRVRLSQWQPGGLVTLTFAKSVESQSGSQGENAPTAVEYATDALGAEHTFELGAHPDASHGFSFVVRSAEPSVQVQRLTCKPSKEVEAKQTVTEAAPRAGSPDAPTSVKAHALGCDSIALEWKSAVDNGFSVQGYRVYYRRREATDASFATLEVDGGGGATRATLSGLSGGTTYYLKVRARNSVGEGKYSARVDAETPSGGVPKTAPTAMTSLSSPDCQTLRLALPSLRPGCHGESFLSLKMRSFGRGGGWNDAVAMAAESEARIEELDPWEVYELRAVPHNGRGVGPPSESTGPLMVGIEGNALAAPLVRAVGSASFSLSWAGVAGPCRPQVKSRVSYRTVGYQNATSWQLLSTETTGSSFLAYPLRCPGGCMFRVESGRGDGRWTAPSAASAVVRSTTLPALDRETSIRLELKLRSEQPDQDTLQMSLDAASDIASALRLQDESAVVVQEVYGAGRYIVADVRSGVQEGQDASSSASMLAQQLALMAQEPMDERWGLRAGVATKEVEGVTMLVDGGTLWTAVHAGKEAKERLWRLSRWYGDSRGGRGGGVLDEARQFVIAVTVVMVLLWFCTGGSARGGYRAVDGGRGFD